MLKDKFVPRTYNIPRFTNWVDTNNKKIDSSKYVQMLVSGDSLEPKNVNDGDLIFVKKKTLSEYSNIELPKICVFNRRSKYEEMTNNHSEYILCDVLARINIFEDDVDNIIDDILNAEQFKKYRNDVRYVSNEFIKSQFVLSQQYPNISIYPHLNYDNNWVLEWVNSRDFYGTVEYSSTINQK